MGIKTNDIHGAFGCSSCHDEVDARTMKNNDRQEVRLAFYEAVIRTQILLIKGGLM
jgi:hypothetical protein